MTGAPLFYYNYLCEHGLLIKKIVSGNHPKPDRVVIQEKLTTEKIMYIIVM